MTVPTPGQPGPDQSGFAAGQQQPGYGPQSSYHAQPGYGPQGYSYHAQPGYGPQSYGYGPTKNHIVAVVLSILLGGLGVDRFYLGHIGLGVAKLLLSWLTFGVWWLIDVILIAAKATDGLKQINWEQ